jgi:hypothetical protein
MPSAMARAIAAVFPHRDSYTTMALISSSFPTDRRRRVPHSVTDGDRMQGSPYIMLGASQSREGASTVMRFSACLQEAPTPLVHAVHRGGSPRKTLDFAPRRTRVLPEERWDDIREARLP